MADDPIFALIAKTGIHWPNRINAAGRIPGQVPTLDGEELRPV